MASACKAVRVWEAWADAAATCWAAWRHLGLQGLHRELVGVVLLAERRLLYAEV